MKIQAIKLALIGGGGRGKNLARKSAARLRVVSVPSRRFPSDIS